MLVDNSQHLLNTLQGSITITKIYRHPKNSYLKLLDGFCSCGNLIVGMRLKNLLSSKTTKCCKVCASRQNAKKANQASHNKHAYKYELYLGKTINYFTVLDRATKEEILAYYGKYYYGRLKCKCICGNIRYLSLQELGPKTERKSCGCKAKEINSIRLGGTGTPGEIRRLNDFLRDCPEGRNWRLNCFKQANFKCQLTGKSADLVVHHIVPLHLLVKQYNITLNNYTEYLKILFDKNNGIVLTSEVHKNFHRIYGINCSVSNIEEFKLSYLNTI